MSAYAQKQSADAAAKAQAQNQANFASDRALAYQMFLQGRGQGGSALLPMYFTGTSTEQNLANNAWAQYLANQSAMGTPAEQMARYQAIVQGAMPGMAAGDALVNQLMTGQLTDQQVANMAPVQAARGSLAAAQSQSVMEGLKQQINALTGMRARQGYTGGGGTFEKNLLTAATIPALQQAAQVGAQANLANATETANIRNQGLQQRLGSLNLPLAQGANRVTLTQLPQTAMGAGSQAAMSPFNWFKLQPGTFDPGRTPLIQPIPTTGQIAAQGVGTAATQMGQYFANRALINQMNQGYGGYGNMPENYDEFGGLPQRSYGPPIG